MTKNSLNKMLVEAALGKAIKDLQTDPEQTLKRWVEKSSSKVQKGDKQDLVEQFRGLLTVQKGHYAALIQRLVQEVSTERLKTLSLNLAYYAFKLGTETAKEQELRYGVHIPFTVFFEMDGTVTASHIKSIADQGKKLGIYTYQLFCRTERALATLPELFSAHKECVFVVYLRPESVTKPLVDDWAKHLNVIPMILTKDGRSDEAFALFRAAGFLCGTCLEYDGTKINPVASAEYLAQAARMGAPLAALWPLRGVTSVTMGQVRNAVNKQRLQQAYPVLPIDLVGDLLEADRLLTNESALLYFDSKGQRRCMDDAYREGDENLFHNSFIQILEAL